jgi:hypothetical protein
MGKFGKNAAIYPLISETRNPIATNITPDMPNRSTNVKGFAARIVNRR